MRIVAALPSVLLVAATACDAPDTPAAQLARGAERYDEACRHCHDLEGGIGVPLDPRAIGSYGTARRLFDYLRVAMPYGAPGSLPETSYWDLTAFLASDRGARALPGVLNAGSADSVGLRADTAGAPGGRQPPEGDSRQP